MLKARVRVGASRHALTKHTHKRTSGASLQPECAMALLSFAAVAINLATGVGWET